MSKEIILSDSQIALYIPVLKQDIKEQEESILKLEKELFERNSRLHANRELLTKLTENSNGVPVNNSSNNKYSYSKEWTLVQKIEFILLDHLTELPVRDICDVLCKLEPEIVGDRPLQVFKTTVAATLGNYAKLGNIFYRDVSDFPIKYGLLKWKKQ